MTVDIAPDLPRGEAAVLLAYSRGLLPATLRENHLPWPAAAGGRERRKAGPPARISDRQGLAVGPRLAGGGLLSRARPRGGLQLRALRGVEIAYTPQSVQPAKITVFGQSKQQLGIMFIFDCSGSMGTPIVGRPGRRERAEDQRGPRRLPRSARLAGRRQGRLPRGLMAYGHRVWRNDGWFTQFPKGDLLDLGRRQQQDRAREPAQPAQSGPGEPRSRHRRADHGLSRRHRSRP